MAGSFKRLLNLTVEHDYFADGLMRGLDFKADQPTAKLLALPWMAARSNDHGLAVAVEPEGWGAFADRSSPLRFLVSLRDPELWWLINPALVEWQPEVSGKPSTNKLPRLSTKGAKADDDGRLRLHRGAYIGKQDLRAMPEDAKPNPLVTARRPVFELILEPDPAGEERNCVVRLPAPQVFWTYRLTSQSKLGDLNVVDADGKARFQALGGDLNRNTGLLFRSTKPLPVLEQSPLRFQVSQKREQVNGTPEKRDAVIVRRLPSASPNFVLIPGREDRAVQAEIFVNL